MTVGRSAARAARRAGSKSASRSTRTPARPARPGDRREVDRPELGRDADPGPASLLPHPDRAVPLVVEDDDDDPRRRRGRRSRARPWSSPARRRRRAPRPADRDGRAPPRSPPGGRSPSPPTSARGTSRAAGTGSRGPPSRRSCRRRWSGSRRRAGPGAASRSSGPDGRPVRPTAWRRRRSPPPRPPGRRGCCAWRVATSAASRTARPSSRSLAALQERLRVGRDRDRRRGEAGRPGPGRDRRGPSGRSGPRHRVAERRRPRSGGEPRTSERVGGVEPLADRSTRPRSRPSRGRADGRSR